MKQVILIILTIFLLPCDAYASTIEEDLSLLIENVKDLKKRTIDFDEKILNKVYPIGSIYESTNYSTVEEVQNIIGGKWERYGNGKTLIGVDESNSNFNVVNKTGGTKTNTLAITNLPNHTHSIPVLSGTAAKTETHTHSIPSLTGTAESAGSHTHALRIANDNGNLNVWGATWKNSNETRFTDTNGTQTTGAHTHSIKTIASNVISNGDHTHSISLKEGVTGNLGSATAFTNLNPYITVYMYKRIS